MELPEHPWFVGCQFHPEFRSRPGKSHPLFRGFVHAAVAYAGYEDELEELVREQQAKLDQEEELSTGDSR